ncbi:hypothetical protein R70723_14460 [Paenibacillus sp. FSL R7-0273]|uniref:ABC-2 transporter permease n=1 Tax=Paenibacillus sp. FSL R7-0273 TaxID=1536772 RepID=UPI0004F5DADC|nr:ABC-2 transporter permease [Paenibacillus sp. FSL R7-0273]AIQ46947.1 hypothetical protein R70723_14460 [Paenibacillus sp. FSL R7-0273]OMF97295.1 hypothetical protein BK144_01155 [Paenibacillus sp. FSL R7-0273]
MRGLLLNNYYSMQSNLKVSLGISLCLLLVSLFASDITALNAVIAGQIMVFSVSIGASQQVDEAANWNRMEITLPVRRSTVIHAKYLSFIMLIVMGIGVSLCTPVLNMLKAADPAGFAQLWNGYTFGLSLSISTISLCFPAILKFGVEKNEMMLFLSAGISVGLRIGVWALMNFTGKSVNFNGSEVGTGFLMLSLVMFAVSYLVSVRIQQSKEF